MTTLSEHLHAILVKIRDSFDADVPDPAALTHSGEMEIRGHMVTARSSAPLGELMQHQTFTVYLHSKSKEETTTETIRYFHFEGRNDFSFLNIYLHKNEDGSLKQQIEVSTKPLNMVMERINRHLHQQQQRRGREEMMQPQNTAL